MGWVESKSVRFILPAFTDEFIRSESGEGLESFGEVISGDEVIEVSIWLVATASGQKTG